MAKLSSGKIAFAMLHYHEIAPQEDLNLGGSMGSVLVVHMYLSGLSVYTVLLLQVQLAASRQNHCHEIIMHQQTMVKRQHEVYSHLSIPIKFLLIFLSIFVCV